MRYTAPFSSREIYCDGKPFITIHRAGDTDPSRVDSTAHFILMLLNEYGEEFERFHRRYMRQNPRRTYRRNPGLVIYGNPPRQLEIAEKEIAGPFSLGGVISKEVHLLAYKHAKDGQDYQHDFEDETWMAGVVSKRGRRDVILFSPSGEPLWQDF